MLKKIYDEFCHPVHNNHILEITNSVAKERHKKMKSRLRFTQSTCWFSSHFPFLSWNLCLDFVEQFFCALLRHDCPNRSDKMCFTSSFLVYFCQTISSSESYEGNKPRSSCKSNAQSHTLFVALSLSHCVKTHRPVTYIYWVMLTLFSFTSSLFCHSESDDDIVSSFFLKNLCQQSGHFWIYFSLLI